MLNAVVKPPQIDDDDSAATASAAPLPSAIRAARCLPLTVPTATYALRAIIDVDRIPRAFVH